MEVLALQSPSPFASLLGWQFPSYAMRFLPPAPGTPTSAPFRPPGRPWLVGGGWGVLPTRMPTGPFGASRSPTGGVWGILSEPNPPNAPHWPHDGPCWRRRNGTPFRGACRTEAVVGRQRSSRGLTAESPLPTSPCLRIGQAAPGGLGGPRDGPISGKVPARIFAILCLSVRLYAIWAICTIR